MISDRTYAAVRLLSLFFPLRRLVKAARVPSDDGSPLLPAPPRPSAVTFSGTLMQWGITRQQGKNRCSKDAAADSSSKQTAASWHGGTRIHQLWT